MKKLQTTKIALKIWNKNSFGNIQTNINLLTKTLKDIQSKDPTPDSTLMEEHIKFNLNEQLRREESLWRQKSRNTWLTTTDLNTKFFHASTTIKRRRNSINCLKFEDRQWTSDPLLIESKFQHFKKIFTTTSPDLSGSLEALFPEKISDAQNEILCKIPTDEEILNTLKQTPSSKAPEPDGFTGLFYKTYWEIVKPDLIATIINFFTQGKLLKAINHTNIALIPKINSPNQVHHFRLISLANVCYKVIAKILANRLKVILLSIISPNQSAFVPGRLI